MTDAINIFVRNSAFIPRPKEAWVFPPHLINTLSKFVGAGMREFIDIIKDLLVEMPLGDYQTLGDFNQDGSFMKKKDRDLVAGDKHKIRLQKILTKTPYTINAYFVNADEETISDISNFKTYKDGKPTSLDNKLLAARERHGGETKKKLVLKKFNTEVSNTKNAISIVMMAAGYEGDHTLSPWMIVHRWIHAIEDSIVFYKNQKRVSPELKKAYDIYESFCTEKTNRFDYLISQATMNSALKNNFKNGPEEITTELLVQYIFKGKITLKTDKEMEAKLNKMAKNIFDACVGKIFVGF